MRGKNVGAVVAAAFGALSDDGAVTSGVLSEVLDFMVDIHEQMVATQMALSVQEIRLDVFLDMGRLYLEAAPLPDSPLDRIPGGARYQIDDLDLRLGSIRRADGSAAGVDLISPLLIPDVELASEYSNWSFAFRHS